MLEYRNVKFEYSERYTWDKKLVGGYTCSDKKLLEGLDTVSFSSPSLEKMHSEIDKYIDNRDKNIELQKLSNKAIAEFYNTNHYKGD